MNKTNQWVSGQLSAMVGVIALASASAAFGAGFQISETSVSGLGRAFAGLGVSGDSISEMFTNPGSLALREGTELEFGIHAIATSADFKNKGSTPPLTGPNSDGGENALVPNLYLAGDINQRMRYGVGITAPFGLATEYDSNWVGRYAAIRSELKTVDINPAISYRLDNGVILGAGVSMIKAEAELTQALQPPDDPRVTLKGDDTGMAWNVGVVRENEKSRIGLGYRSHANLELEGDFSTAPNLGLNGPARASIQLPKTAYLSGSWEMTPKIDLSASIRWTDWSSFQELRIIRANGTPISATTHNWKSTTTTSIGIDYRKSETVTYRGGLAIDESPVSDEFRTARIPDADRIWLTFGASVNVSERTRLDIGYAHIFADSATLSEKTLGGAATLQGEYTDADADILSVAVAFKWGAKQ